MACLSLMVIIAAVINVRTSIINTAEPGFYEVGAFGIRIENVELIRNVETKYNFGGTQFLTMEPLTLVSFVEFIGVKLLAWYASGSHPAKDD